MMTRKQWKTPEEGLIAANKLIFIRRYEEALDLLDSLLNEEEGKGFLLGHLRRAELSSRLGRLEGLLEAYQIQQASGFLNSMVAETGVAFAKQQGELVSHQESIQAFTQIIQKHGNVAAAYYGIAYSFENQGALDRAVYNYEQALIRNPNWYPAYFGLSQIYYNKENTEQGDHYFYLFEQCAPYVLYGNFETHQRLFREYLAEEKYEEAETAMSILPDWWLENKRYCPIEIQFYEMLALERVADLKKNHEDKEALALQIHLKLESLQEDPPEDEKVLYFIIKSLEEFGCFERSYFVYKILVKQSKAPTKLIPQIGSQFLKVGEPELARKLFQEAYEQKPDDPQIREGLLLSKLSLAKVDTNRYLTEKSKFLQYLAQGGASAEILHSSKKLLDWFQDDPEVHEHLAEIYLELGNKERSGQHYRKMFHLDQLSINCGLKYAEYLIGMQFFKDSKSVLDRYDFTKNGDRKQILNANWIYAKYFFHLGDYNQCLLYLRDLSKNDPWSSHGLILTLISKIYLSELDASIKEKFSQALSGKEESEIPWVDLFKKTPILLQSHQYELAFILSKLYFLFSSPHQREEALHNLLNCVLLYDPTEGIRSFLRLLNTNYDNPWIYFNLGVLEKNLWQLETACRWFEVILDRDNDLSQKFRSQVYLELADCYIWRDINLEKSLGYLQFILENKSISNPRVLITMAHAYLKLGMIAQAETTLAQLSQVAQSYEILYLKGLLLYRNGKLMEAKEIWKPLISFKANHLIEHQIKQEVLKYYFEGEPYWKAS